MVTLLCRYCSDEGRDPWYQGYRGVEPSGVTVGDHGWVSRCHSSTTDLAFHNTLGVIRSGVPHDERSFFPIKSSGFSLVVNPVSFVFVHERPDSRKTNPYTLHWDEVRHRV